MYFLKKLVLGLGLLILIYGGSAGTQSSSLFVQGISFIGLLLVALILFIFSRMLVRGLGCLPSLLIMCAVGVFMMYALGLFSNGVSGTFDSFLRFIGRDVDPKIITVNQQNQDFDDTSPNAENEDKGETPEVTNPALFEDLKPQKEQKQEKNYTRLLTNVLSALTGNQPNTEQIPFNPQNYPVIYVVPRVLSGDTFEIQGRYFRLFGIAAPEVNQTCSNAKGHPYNCGKEAALWLKDWIEGGELECHVIQQDTNGNMVGTCSYGPYDIGAALVNAGWAVAYTKYTETYIPYEQQAQQNRSGLWQGRFYKPWDWRKIQQRKATVKIIRPKKKKVGLFG